MQIAERIRKLCAQSGLSLHQLEDEARLGARDLERMLEGHEVPSCDVLARLATALEVPLVRLFCDEGEVVPTPKLTPRLTLQQLAQDGAGRHARVTDPRPSARPEQSGCMGIPPSDNPS